MRGTDKNANKDENSKELIVRAPQYEKALEVARSLNAQADKRLTVTSQSRSILPAVITAVGIAGAVIAGAAAALNTLHTVRHSRDAHQDYDGLTPNSVTSDDTPIGSSHVSVQVTFMRVDVLIRSTNDKPQK